MFIPIRYYVGDTVELKFSLVLSEDEKFAPVDFKEIKNEFVEVNSFIYKPERGEIVIQFVSFYVGSNTLPSIYVGDVIKNDQPLKVVLKNIKINTSKLLSEDDSLRVRNIESVLFIPGTSAYLVILILALVVVPYIFIRLLKLVRHLLAFLIMRHNLGKPYRIFQKQFVILSNYIKSDKEQIAFYNLLNSTLRVYLSKKTGFDFNAITTPEISEILQNLNVPYEIRSTLINILRISDFSKFSGINLPGGNLSLVLEDLKRAALSFEEFNRSTGANI
ncbi:hypothetical protein LKV13_00845 [Borrelia sp. BU AG58]|nr:hypothetical protein [Borrelia sp. BU AG58]UER68004.1 hypothetical protein LKV13_00845 [Borrelia sp. BU AG58]